MYLGIDFGTSGCRACVIDSHENIIFEAEHSLAAPIQQHNCSQDPTIWWNGLLTLFKQIAAHSCISKISDICINGTSATVVHCTKDGTPLSPALMYNDQSSIEQTVQIKNKAPSGHVCNNPSSALSKMMLLYSSQPIDDSHMLNQADWLSNMLCQQFGYSDYHNVLKMGYDLENDCWPEWLQSLIPKALLPKVYAPGTILGNITSELSKQFGFNPNVRIKLGTTDSIAAFIATGVKQTDQAVTSLGSTLVLKQLSTKPINHSQFGIYSHKFGRYWLSGGASNSGGCVLKQFFTAQQLQQLSEKIDYKKPSGLDYYPLASMGERFPVYDPEKTARLTPKPSSDVDFLHGLFEGIASIECMGYQKLVQFGAQFPKHIISCGGGAKNQVWTQIRSRIIATDISTATHSEACYGSALLAKNGMRT